MPLPAVRVMSFRPVSDDVLSALRPESALLVDACPVSAPHGEWSLQDADGNSYAWAAVDHSLQWNLSGRALARNGLVNDLFPGLPLSTAIVPFLNGGVIPFDFDPAVGTLFYDSPVFAPEASRLPAFSCTITRRFARRRGESSASGDGFTGAGGGSSSVAWFLPSVPVFRFSEAALIALAEDVFTDTAQLSGALQASFYQGIPGSGGTEKFAPLAYGEWDELSSGGESLRASLEKEWDAPGADKSFNYLLLRRAGGSGFTLRTLLLPDTFTAPAALPLRATAASLRAALTWPHDGARGLYAFAGVAAGHLLHGVLTPGENLGISVYDGDPDNGGVLLASWEVPQDSGDWSITGSGTGSVTISNAVAFTGGDARPVGSAAWNGSYVAVSRTAGYVLKKQLTTAVTPAEGESCTIPIGALSLVIS